MAARPSRPSLDRTAQAESACIIFAKAPIPGEVKTRLCHPLTDDEAASLHGSFVLDTLERTKGAVAKHHLSAARYLACSPSASHVFFQIMEERHGVTIFDQVGDDLGARMLHAFSTVFSRGHRKALIVGTDVPSLPADYYRQALTSLDHYDLMLGPATDGGYYMIALKHPRPELFTGIPWSTDQVLKLTRERAEGLGLKISLLPEWRDVDTLADLQALIKASALDSKRPKHEQIFSTRTAGALQFIGKQLASR